MRSNGIIRCVMAVLEMETNLLDFGVHFNELFICSSNCVFVFILNQVCYKFITEIWEQKTSL